MAKIDLRCENARCVSDIVAYGANYHDVHGVQKAPAYVPDATARCERCGGFHNGTEWKHVCKVCGTNVAAGALRGYFVPHRCAECDDKLIKQQQAAGDTCRRCNTVIAYCCC